MGIKNPCKLITRVSFKLNKYNYYFGIPEPPKGAQLA